jgi:hypothetical protein
MMGRASLVIWIRKHNPSPGSWSGVALPIIKSVFAPILAKDFISVQPMSLPAGQVFYMDFKYGYIVIIWDQELWWEEDCNGNWVCPETQEDHKISDHDWIEQRDERLIIPKWEIEQQEKHVGGLGNEQIGYGKVYLDDLPYNPPIKGVLQRASGKSGGRTYPVMRKYAK